MKKYKDKNLPVRVRTEDLLSRMTIEEKIGQLNQLSAKLSDADEMRKNAAQGLVSSRVMASTAFAGNEEQEITGFDEINLLQELALNQSRLGIPLMDGWDIVHGQRTIFPLPLAQAAGWAPELVQRAAEIAALETAEWGVRWTFAPMLDIARDPRWGRIVEGFGEDPYLCAQMAAASVKGFQGESISDKRRIAACAKHYIGYGMSCGGRDYSACDCSEHELRNTYLPPFKAAVEAGAATVMASFNEIGGEPVTGSKHLLTDILKGELGFQGFVVSDWYAIHQLINQGVAENRKEAAYIAFDAGVDMDMLDLCYSEHLPALIEEGRISKERLDDAVRRILEVKFRLGLFDDPYVDPNASQSIRDEHMEFAKAFAEKCMVLLKNEDNVLPLPKSGRKIAVIGPLAEAKRALMGSWTQNKSDEGIQTIVEGVQAAAPEAEIITASSLYDEMLMAAQRAEMVVLVLGESDRRNGEHACIADIELPVGQLALLRAVRRLGKPVVSVICSGRPLVLEEVDHLSDAVLYAWHSGHQTGPAAAEILFGNVNPSGKLPVTFPRTTGQIPIYYNHKPNARQIDEYYYPESTDYFDTTGKPMYPFGYGLSYTTFAYSGLTIDKEKITADEVQTVRVTVTNTGNMEGDEIVQCYLRDCFSALTRPLKELKGFQRIHLVPGASQEVVFTLDREKLGYYGKGGKFCVEPGKFMVYTGGNCLTEMCTQFEIVK